MYETQAPTPTTPENEFYGNDGRDEFLRGLHVRAGFAMTEEVEALFSRRDHVLFNELLPNQKRCYGHPDWDGKSVAELDPFYDRCEELEVAIAAAVGLTKAQWIGTCDSLYAKEQGLRMPNRK